MEPFHSCMVAPLWWQWHHRFRLPHCEELHFKLHGYAVQQTLGGILPLSTTYSSPALSLLRNRQGRACWESKRSYFQNAPTQAVWKKQPQMWQWHKSCFNCRPGRKEIGTRSQQPPSSFSPAAATVHSQQQQWKKGSLVLLSLPARSLTLFSFTISNRIWVHRWQARGDSRKVQVQGTLAGLLPSPVHHSKLPPYLASWVSWPCTPVYTPHKGQIMCTEFHLLLFRSSVSSCGFMFVLSNKSNCLQEGAVEGTKTEHGGLRL